MVGVCPASEPVQVGANTPIFMFAGCMVLGISFSPKWLSKHSGPIKVDGRLRPVPLQRYALGVAL